MSVERLVPGGQFVQETGTRGALVPGGEFVQESVSTGGTTTTLSALTASNISSTGCTASVSIANNAAGTLYLAVYPSDQTPTWSRTTGWSGTPIYTDSDTDPGTGSSYTWDPDVSGLSAGQEYKLWAIWDDGSQSSNGGAPISSAAFTTSYALTGENITADAPTLGAPTLTQNHAITGAGITAGAPALGAPTIISAAGNDALTGAGITAGTPTLGAPTLTQNHALAGGAIAAGSPTFGTPTLAQIHAIMSAGITAGAPALGAPTIISAAGNDALTGAGITAGTPTLGAPTLTQNHAIAGGAIAAGAPTFGTPTLAQIHAIMSAGITAGAPTLGAPTITSGDVPDHPLSGADILSGAPTLGAPTLSTAALAANIWDSLADPIISMLGTQASLDGRIITAIFDYPYQEAFGMISGSAPIATVLASVPVARGSRFDHGSLRYSVAEIHPDGHGLNRLVLEVAA